MEDLLLILSFIIGALSILILIIQYIVKAHRRKKKALTHRSKKKISYDDKTKADNEIISYKEKGYSYYPKYADSEGYGENKIYEPLIKSYQPQGCKFLFNAYLPKNDEETTEIDLLMISPVGIFVFEIKNYIGCIVGDKESQFWTQVKTDDRGEKISNRFFNPIMQNEIHVKNLNLVVNFEYPVHSIVVFSDRCTLYNEDLLNRGETKVTTTDGLCEIVETFFKYMSHEMSDDDIESAYNILYPYTQVSNEVKAKHIQNIQDKYGV